MTQRFIKTKPSFLEAGLPCASLSAECQRDNNARQRPPQNRLHIWWARRPPTICRVAILSALLPHDVKLGDAILPGEVPEPTEADMEALPGKSERLRDFFRSLLTEVPATVLSPEHRRLLRSLGILGDAERAYRRLALAEEADNGRQVTLGSVWGYRHPRAFAVPPSSELLAALQESVRQLLGLKPDDTLTMLDSMGGGGAIPLEGIRYGFKVYANELNPVAALVLKATLEYPARFGRSLAGHIRKYALQVHGRVVDRLKRFFPFQASNDWWPEEEAHATAFFHGKDLVRREPAIDHVPKKNTYLWLRTVPCPKCGLKIPLSTNFHIVTKKGNSEASIAVFPEVPPIGHGNDCTFRVVAKHEWPQCRWPRLGTKPWNPRETTTYRDGYAICPRCRDDSPPVDEAHVKKFAQSHHGGLPSQMYAVCSQVPVMLTYNSGRATVRYLWRFRAPTNADLVAVRAAEQELDAHESRWGNLIPAQEIPEASNYNRGHCLYGVYRYREMFLPRQVLTAATVLEEVRAATVKARTELPADEAEAVAVFLAFIVSKVINYNSVNTFWHYGRKTVAQSFSRHDFAFRPAFCEFEGARETVMWAANQCACRVRKWARSPATGAASRVASPR